MIEENKGMLSMEVNDMSRRKANPLTNGLSSPEIEGQGTTNRETGRKKVDSSRKKKKRT
jgi:hypothetical protein